MLARRLEDYQFELEQGLQRDIETHRLSSLGQMTGLVVHDLATQIGNLKLSIESVTNPPVDSSVANEKGAHAVHAAHAVQHPNLASVILISKHMEGLLESLRAKLRNPGSPPKGQCRLGDAIDYASVLLRISEGIPSATPWQIKASYHARELMIAMPQSDVIQIVMNLGSNAIRAMQAKKEIIFTVNLSSRDEKFATFAMTDNGSGLTRDRFSDLTAISDLGRDAVKVREGLGLRLVCRMVERAGGSITVGEDSDASGTTMYLKLPLA